MAYQPDFNENTRGLNATLAQRQGWAARYAANKAGNHSAKIVSLPRVPTQHPALAPRPDSRPADVVPRDRWTANQEKLIYAKIQADIKAARSGKKSTKPAEMPADVMRSKQNEIDRAAARKAPKGATIRATTDSTCLSDLFWKAYPDGDGEDGTITAVFWKRDDGTGWSWECTKDEALDWMLSPSLGVTGNLEWFD
jgi:hypothetical protein